MRGKGRLLIIFWMVNGQGNDNVCSFQGVVEQETAVMQSHSAAQNTNTRVGVEGNGRFAIGRWQHTTTLPTRHQHQAEQNPEMIAELHNAYLLLQ